MFLGAFLTDVAARPDLTYAGVLGEALARRPYQGPLHFELDLADMCYLDAHCAWLLIDLAASLPAGDRLVIRCTRTLEMVLRGLGSDAVPQLELVVGNDVGSAAGVA
jgi:hypothetical protein